MSKTIDLQNKAKQEQNNYLNGTLAKQPSQEIKTASIQFAWLIGGVSFVILILILFFNIRFLLMAKNYDSVKEDYAMEINKLGEALNQNHQEIRNRLDAIDSVIEDNIKKSSQLEQTVDANNFAIKTNNFAIKNLTKAKNTLFKRVTELEAKGLPPQGTDPEVSTDTK